MTPSAIRRNLLVAASLVLALTVGACDTSATTARGLTSCHVAASDFTIPGGAKSVAPVLPPGTLAIDGSTALAPLFQQAKGNVTANAGNSGVAITITPNGSGTGLSDVEKGAVQIGMSDVFAQERATATTNYSDLVDNQVAVVPFTLVVSQDIASQVENLTTQQIKDIYAGNVTNWSQVGGPNEPITVVVRTKTSGTRATFDKFVLSDPKQLNDEPASAQTADKTSELVTDITNSHGAIGYTGTSFVLDQTQAGKIFPICIDGLGATRGNINAGTYKFWNIEHAYTKGPPEAGSLAGAFLQYLNSAAFQNADLASQGFLRVSDLSKGALSTHLVPTPTPTP